MIGLARALFTVTACGWVMMVAAQTPAPTTTVFDGRYVGVSRESSKAGSNPGAKCPPNAVPAPLTIRNGVIGRPSGSGWQGTVTPEGHLTMQNGNSFHVEGQVDPQGTIRAQYSGPACIETFVWRKQSG